MRRHLLALAAAATLVPAGASAEYRSGPYVGTVGIGPALLENDLGTTFHLSGRIDLGTFTENLVWDAGFHWWKKSETTTLTVFDFQGQPISSTDIETRVRDLAFTSGVKYLFPVTDPKLFPFARAGLGLNFLDVAVETEGVGSVSADDTDLGLHLGGGVQWLISPSLMLGTELTWVATDADHLLFGASFSFPLGHRFQTRSTSPAPSTD